MTPQPRVSVLIDSYNYGHFIEEAIDSVLSQDFPAGQFELIVVDDGSTDDTAERVRKYGARVKYLHKPNGGQASAFNLGFSQSTGEIIAFLDGDDWWAKGKLTAAVDALEKNPQVGAIGHGHYKFYQATQETVPYVSPSRMLVNLETPGAIRSWNYMLPGALTVRRKVLDWIMPIPEEMIFMADSAIMAAATVMGTLILEEPLFYYRLHSQNLHAITSADQADERTQASLRRKAQMAALVYGTVHRRLIELGVPEEKVSALLQDVWLDARRTRLQLCGGARTETFQTEMESFRASAQNPSLGYRIFKYLAVGAATMLLPARKFYAARALYSKLNLGRYRERLFRKRS